jgi:SAM-dependent methyltransferase
MSFTRRLAKKYKPFIEAISLLECRFATTWVEAAYRRLMAIQWRVPPVPEHFDHHIDLHYWWLQNRDPMWVERGAFGVLALHGQRVLELACGDGFNARNFYSGRSSSVVACDFDPAAIATATRKNQAPNLTFVLADIRSAMPIGTFENIVWDAAIEHFTPDEIAAIMIDIKARLTPNGVLSGYTIAAQAGGQKQLVHHEYEFPDKEDLLRFLTPYFAHAVVFETFSVGRHNLYFYASDGVVPFSSKWRHAVWSLDEARVLPDSK